MSETQQNKQLSYLLATMEKVKSCVLTYTLYIDI